VRRIFSFSVQAAACSDMAPVATATPKWRRGLCANISNAAKQGFAEVPMMAMSSPLGGDNSTVGASTLSKFTVKALALGELPLDGEAGLGTASAFSSLMRCTRGKLAFYEFIHAY
jgi:hypothetical protein